MSLLLTRTWYWHFPAKFWCM